MNRKRFVFPIILGVFGVVAFYISFLNSSTSHQYQHVNKGVGPIFLGDYSPQTYSPDGHFMQMFQVDADSFMPEIVPDKIIEYFIEEFTELVPITVEVVDVELLLSESDSSSLYNQDGQFIQMVYVDDGIEYFIGEVTPEEDVEYFIQEFTDLEVIDIEE